MRGRTFSTGTLLSMSTGCGLVLAAAALLVSAAGCFDGPFDFVRKLEPDDSGWESIGSVRTISDPLWECLENERGDIFAFSSNEIYLRERGSDKCKKILDVEPWNITARFIDGETGYIYVAMENSGVFRSTDGGESWEPVNNHLSSAYIRVLAADGRGGIFAVSDDGRIYKSTNCGELWEEVANLDGHVKLGCMGKNGNLYIVMFNNVIVKYRDGRDGWMEIRYPPDVRNVVSLHVDEVGSMVVVGYEGKLCRSHDEGQSWDVYTVGEDDEMWLRDFSCARQGVCYLVGNGKVYRSVNDMKDWTPLPGDIDGTLPYSVYASSAGRIFVGCELGLLCYDGCGRWVVLGNEERYIYRIIPCPRTDGGLFVLTESGLFSIYPGSRKVFLSFFSWLRSECISDVCPGPDGSYYALDPNGILRSDDFGRTWEEYSYGHVGGQAIAVDSSGTFYVGDGRNLYVSSDGGGAWNHSLRADDDIFYICPMGEGLVFVVTSDRIYRSPDGGGTWEVVMEVWGASPIRRTSDGTLYGCAHTHEGVMVSYDDGATWSWTGQSDIQVTLEAIDVTPDGRIVAGSREEGYIFYSEDGGETWVLDPMRFPGVKEIEIDENGYVYMVVYRKIYRSRRSIILTEKELRGRYGAGGVLF